MAPAPGLAAKEAQEIEIVWLNGATSECENIIYNQELGWVCFITYSESGYAVYDVSTGTRIEEFDVVGPFSEGLAPVGNIDADGHWKYGFVDKSGKLVVPLEYDDAGYVYNPYDVVFNSLAATELCWVRKGLSYGVFKNPYYSAASRSGKSNRGGFPTVPAIIVVAVAAVIVLLVLRLRKKNPAKTVPQAAMPPEASAPKPIAPAAVPPQPSPAAPAQAPQTPAAKAVFCPWCGAKADPGAAFCPGCGRELPR